MMSALSSNQPQRPKKRPLFETCSFCESAPAAVVANLSTGGKRKLKTPLCWLHFHTSRAVREETVEILVEEEKIATELEESGVQDLFAEAYLELQQELATEAALSFKKQKSDPLSMLSNFRGKPKKPPAPPRNKDDVNAGGFMRTVAAPERFQRTQEAVRKQQEQEIARIQAAAAQNQSGNPYQKRKPSRKSIWKLAMEKPTQEERNAKAVVIEDSSVTCSCGSNSVITHGNVTSRNNDSHKAETWGFKDRSDEVIVRYQCNKCGKTWNEED
jgi:hypothetical protein